MDATDRKKSSCACCRFRPEFWQALWALRLRIREQALADFFSQGCPYGTDHLHELLNCIDDYLQVAREEGYLIESD